MTDKKDPQMMDPTAKEGEPVATAYHPRTVMAVEQLIEEVTALFPEVVHEVSIRNPRNEAFGVEFSNYTDYDDTFDALMALVAQDHRVRLVGGEETPGVTKVVMHPDPRTQDDRTLFGVQEAYLVLEDGTFDAALDAEQSGSL